MTSFREGECQQINTRGGCPRIKYLGHHLLYYLYYLKCGGDGLPLVGLTSQRGEQTRDRGVIT